jgi:hypothetical protein
VIVAWLAPWPTAYGHRLGELAQRADWLAPGSEHLERPGYRQRLRVARYLHAEFCPVATPGDPADQCGSIGADRRRRLTGTELQATDAIGLLTAGIGAFLDAVLEPEVQRIVITDAPAVLGLARFTELDERYAFAATVAALEAANEAGALHVADPPTLARLLFGALTRAGLLIASSAEPRATRDAVAATLRAMISGFAVQPD